MKDAQIAAMIRKNAAKGSQPKKPPRASFDPTLEATRQGKEPIDGTDAEQIFKEMKKREF